MDFWAFADRLWVFVDMLLGFTLIALCVSMFSKKKK